MQSSCQYRHQIGKDGRNCETSKIFQHSIVYTHMYSFLQMLDLILFIMILSMIILAFGTLSVAILEPRTPLDRHIVKNVIKRPYFQMYGELHLEEFESGKH